MGWRVVLGMPARFGDDGRGRGWGVALGIALAIGWVGACKPKSTTAPDSGNATDGQAVQAETPVGAATEDAPDGDPPTDVPANEAPKCTKAGTPWDGSRSAGCTYEHAGCCYPDPASLCAAAGCPDDTCRIIESRPAQATCG